MNDERPPRPEGMFWQYGPPPTEAQLAAHAKRGGWWTYMNAAGLLISAPLLAGQTVPAGPTWWTPCDATALYCAWPTIVGAARWDFADGSWCDPHPAALSMTWNGESWHGDGEGVRADGEFCPAGDTIAERVCAAFDAIAARRAEPTPDLMPRSVPQFGAAAVTTVLPVDDCAVCGGSGTYETPPEVWDCGHCGAQVPATLPDEADHARAAATLLDVAWGARLGVVVTVGPADYAFTGAEAEMVSDALRRVAKARLRKVADE